MRKKLKLSHVFESYWDMLPPELHELIMAYKRGQEEIDEEKKERMREVCNEIVMYGRVKKKWGIGHIKCIVKRRRCFARDNFHMRVVGCYVDFENVERETFLAYSLKKALQRVNNVKSCL